MRGEFKKLLTVDVMQREQVGRNKVKESDDQKRQLTDYEFKLETRSGLTE